MTDTPTPADIADLMLVLRDQFREAGRSSLQARLDACNRHQAERLASTSHPARGD